MFPYVLHVPLTHWEALCELDWVLWPPKMYMGRTRSSGSMGIARVNGTQSLTGRNSPKVKFTLTIQVGNG